MEEQIELIKEAFLNQYNPQRAIEQALTMAVNRSVQRANVYCPHTTPERRAEIRAYWKELLIEISRKYYEIQTIEIIEIDMLELQRRMNELYYNDFCHPRYPNQPGFRLAQAQKSISLFLKHLWCMHLIPTPPVCPVDARILTHTELINTGYRWTSINTLEEYRIGMNAIINAAGDNNFVEWELLTFNQ